MKYCVNCGTQNKESVNFCENCGKNPRIYVNEQKNLDSSKYQNPIPPYYHQLPPSSSKVPFIIIGVVVFFVILTVVASAVIWSITSGFLEGSASLTIKSTDEASINPGVG